MRKAYHFCSGKKNDSVLALILAGGYGKRLRPLTESIPKPLVKVGGKPIIYWQIKWLESFGVSRFVLLAGYRSGKLAGYIRSIGYQDKVKVSVERTPLGSAGAIRNAMTLLGKEEEFLLVNGDNITDMDIGKLKLRKGQLACLSIVPYKSTRGVVRFSGSRITGFEEKQFIGGLWVNAGIMLVSSKILKSLPVRGSLEADVFPRLAKAGKLSCVKVEGSYFNSVDYFKDLEEVDGDIRSGKVRFS